MTSVLNPSPWYSALFKYKEFEEYKFSSVLASIAYTVITKRADNIADHLGGPPSLITIVPSKKTGNHYPRQRLRASLAMVKPLAELLAHTLDHIPGKVIQRRGYNPSAFSAGPTSVRGARVLLIEDTWVTGATAMSAAEGARGERSIPGAGGTRG